MPPKKRKRKAKPPTQRQSQRQSVVVNIGSKSTPRKSSGRGNLPPPSHAHNLAPTFVTAPQIDYTPLLAMIQQHARPIVAQAPMPVTTTPLSASIQASNAEQMAGDAALRRAGQTAGNFQHPASEVRIRAEPSKLKTNISERRAMGSEDKDAPKPQVRQADSYVTQQLIQPKPEPGSGGGIPFAESRPASAGRPKLSTQKAVPLDPRAAEEPKSKAKQAKAKESQGKDIMSMLSFKKQGL